jgi:hypothetical protein
MSQELNSEFKTSVVDFMTKYPMEIDAGQFADPVPLGEGEGFRDRVNFVTAMKKTSKDEAKGDFKFKVIESKNKAVFCDFEPGTGNPLLEGLVVPKMYQQHFGGGVRMFYLPWGDNERHALDLKDPPTAIHPTNYFMTASMHGCRFEIHQKPDNSFHVSHSNVQKSDAAPDPQAMIQYLREADVGRGHRVLKFGKRKYFADAERLIGSARHRMLTEWNIAPEDVLEAFPETYKANVLGKRTGPGVSDWVFYYQLWGILKVQFHERVKKKKWLGLKTAYKDVTQTASLKYVFMVKEIFPRTQVLFKLHTNPDT